MSQTKRILQAIYDDTLFVPGEVIEQRILCKVYRFVVPTEPNRYQQQWQQEQNNESYNRTA